MTEPSHGIEEAMKPWPRIVKGILRTMSQDQKQRLATKIVNANREKLMRKLNEYASGKGIDVHICDCAATFR